MKEKTKDKLRKIRKRGLFEKFFFNRGKSLWSDLIELLTLTTIVGLFVDKVNSAFNMNFDVGRAMIAVPFIVILYWITGRIDYKKLHLIQIENEIAMEANPALYGKIKQLVKWVEKILIKLKINL